MSAPLRIERLVYFPISPARDMRISRIVPLARVRWKRPNETDASPTLPAAATLLCFLIGQLRPLHVIVMRVPREARIESSLRLMPRPVRVLTNRTSGNGCKSGSAREPTGIVSAATLEAPLASVTRSRTR